MIVILNSIEVLFVFHWCVLFLPGWWGWSWFPVRISVSVLIRVTTKGGPLPSLSRWGPRGWTSTSSRGWVPVHQKLAQGFI